MDIQYGDAIECGTISIGKYTHGGINIDDIVCTCGNTGDGRGFYPVNEHGLEIDSEDYIPNTGFTWVARMMCAECGAVAYVGERPDGLEILDMARVPASEMVAGPIYAGSRDATGELANEKFVVRSIEATPEAGANMHTATVIILPPRWDDATNDHATTEVHLDGADSMWRISPVGFTF